MVDRLDRFCIDSDLYKGACKRRTAVYKRVQLRYGAMKASRLIVFRRLDEPKICNNSSMDPKESLYRKKWQCSGMKFGVMHV